MEKKFDFYDDKDSAYDESLPQMRFLAEGFDAAVMKKALLETQTVFMPDGQYVFFHEAAIISFHGVLYASWYNNDRLELIGRTPIRGRRSYDGGKTWSDIEVLADDPAGEILYCPPVYGICGDRLYLFMNEMVSADHMHALDLYVLNEESGVFEFLWSRPLPFKLNTNVVTLSDGKLMLPGRLAEPDGFPNTPAVLISDSGKIDADWRLVKIAEDGNLSCGDKLIHPELSAITDGDRVYMFCRDDERHVPLVYLSEDNGGHWTGPYAHDIPFTNSKIYSGTLSDGRNYLIGNVLKGREKLAVFFSKPGEMTFTEGFLLQDGGSADLPGDGLQWSYPCACEADGILYVIYTGTISEDWRTRDPRLRMGLVTGIPLQSGK